MLETLSFVWVFVSQWKCSKNRIYDSSSHPVYKVQKKTNTQQPKTVKHQNRYPNKCACDCACKNALVLVWYISPTLEQVRTQLLSIGVGFRNRVPCAPIARSLSLRLCTSSERNGSHWECLSISRRNSQNICVLRQCQTFRCFSMQRIFCLLFVAAFFLILISQFCVSFNS